MSAHARYASPLVPEIELSVHADLLAREGDGYPTYFACAWPAGEALARFLLDRPELVRERRVLDFGTGCGIVAIAAKLAGAVHVAGIDRDPRAVESLARNAEALGRAIDALLGDPLAAPLELDGFELVLAADVFYEDARPSEVGAWLRLEAGRGRRVVVADPGRFMEPLPGMRELEQLRGHRGPTCTIYEIVPSVAPAHAPAAPIEPHHGRRRSSRRRRRSARAQG
jgi:predicted nicotinamide N-methyase